MKEIQLTQGKVAIVDDEDYEWLNQWKWCYTTGYAMRKEPDGHGGETTIKMHRHILGLKSGDGKLGDHINHDTLDNRRINLRVCTKTQNAHNQKLSKNSTSGLKGVTFHKQTGKWRAQITINGKNIHLGLFDKIEDAHSAYKESAYKNFESFANFGNGCVALKELNANS